MFAFNFLYWLSGCIILGVGIWLRVDESAQEFVSKASRIDIINTLSYALMIIGFIIMLIGFLGCCGAVRESQCMLATFFVVLFILFAILLGFGIWAAVEKDKFKDYTRDNLKTAVNNYYKDDEYSTLMDYVQNFFKCCGHTNGNMDYAVVGNIPSSCHTDSYRKPCSSAFNNWIESKLVVIAGIAIGFAIQMLLGMIFSMLLCCAIRDQVA
jgi:CD9 antigen